MSIQSPPLPSPPPLPRNLRVSTFHLCQSVRGALRSAMANPASLDDFTDDEGQPLSRGKVFDNLLQLLAEGNEVLPLGGCDDFDPVKGCRGHINWPATNLAIMRQCARRELEHPLKPRSGPDWQAAVTDYLSCGGQPLESSELLQLFSEACSAEGIEY